MQSACLHHRTQFIARREGVDFFRCRDCGSVYEREDLELFRATEDQEEEEQPE